jgi:hypothetical protein
VKATGARGERRDATARAQRQSQASIDRPTFEHDSSCSTCKATNDKSLVEFTTRA